MNSSTPAAEVPAYAQLQREMHDALRAQHPDWILPSGDSPTCDFYDARFAQLLVAALATERALAFRGRGRNALGPFDDRGKFSMPSGYAEPRKIIFPEMAPAIR